MQPIRFQGQYIDQETGLHYNRFRYYDSDVGMFISRDPIGLMGGSNVFAYAPNPTGWVDPWGLNKQKPNSCDCDKGCPPGTIVKEILNWYGVALACYTTVISAIGCIVPILAFFYYMDPSKIHFIQSSAKNATGDYTVIGNAQSLSNGTLSANTLRIKIWKDNSGKIWTLDHKRLAAFKIAKKCVPYTWASESEIKSQMWKMTTKNGGTSIRIKMDNGKSITVK